jgi:hypothetical protein
VLALSQRLGVVGVIASLAIGSAAYLRVRGPHPRTISRAEFREPSGTSLAGFFDGLPKDPRYDLKKVNANAAAVPQSACSSPAPSLWSRTLGKFFHTKRGLVLEAPRLHFREPARIYSR